MRAIASIKSDKDWQALLSYLPEDYSRLAHEHHVLNPQWPNAKVTDAQTLLRFILLHVGADLPLRQTVAVIAEAGGPKVAPIWLHKRMRAAQPYLAALIERMVSDIERSATPERWAGYEMVCLDGSSVSGPGSDGTDLRMHAVLRLHDLRVRDVRVTPVTDGETLRNFMWAPGQLILVDRGYANAPGLAWAVDQGADVLVRVNRGALPLYVPSSSSSTPSDEPIDILRWCRGLGRDEAAERAAVAAVAVHGKGRKRREVAGRLIGLRLPPLQAREARERVRREEGPSVTAEQLEAAAYIILFTTAPLDRLSAPRCTEAYRLRWQVELQFKRWKSICNFDRLPNYRDDTMLSWLTAKVLLGMLLDRVASASGDDEIHRSAARQPWKLTSILWPLVVSALLPLGFANAPDRLSALVQHLDSLDEHDAQRQVAAFRETTIPSDGVSAN
jgi:hypothetical protein